MTTTARLAAFAAALAAVFLGGWAAGAAIGPFDSPDRPAPAHTEHTP